jgi:signal transduction histidine kinase
VTRFTVRDTGHGIKPADRTRLFGAFAQIESSSSAAEEGTGLGLHICQTLTTIIGAAIALESEPGKGSAFTLELVDRVVADGQGSRGDHDVD